MVHKTDTFFQAIKATDTAFQSTLGAFRLLIVFQPKEEENV